MSGLLMGEVETQMGAQAGAPSDAPIVHTATIGAAEAGQRLDRALAAFVNDLSRSRLKTLILAGHVAISGRTISDPGHRVNVGDEVVLIVPPATGPAPWSMLWWPIAALPFPASAGCAGPESCIG